jgi:peptide/nickel transport system ATP-binding protein
MGKNLLTIKNLSIETNQRVLVDGADLAIRQGEVVGLVGESGSGKTLTALSILKLLPPGLRVSGGQLLFSTGEEVIDLAGLSETEMNRFRGNRISMIFQEPMSSLNPTLTCGYQAREPLMIHRDLTKKEARENVLALFEEVGLPDPERIFRAWPHELSGGQRQRVMIAQALTTSPSLLIADEPTTALDVTVQKKILELLRSLKQKYHLGILFISHDLSVIGQIADTVSVMKDGNTIETAATADIMDRPRTPYTRGLIACKPKLDSKPYRLPTVSDFIEGKPPRTDTEKDHKKNRHVDVPLITIRDLHVTFGGGRRKSVHAVQDVSLTIFSGETVGLVGESGSGKTTLGRTILGLVKAKSGSISYLDRPLSGLSEKEFRQLRQKLQIVFQDPYSSLNPRMTAGNIISEPLRVHHIISKKQAVRKECMRLLDLVGLPTNALDRYPHEFSGGQRQRIGIARALACRPDCIVLDESVSALDVSIQAQVLNLLNDLKESFGLTYLFISHDLTVVQYMSDRILVMKEGRIVETVAAGSLYSDPKDPYTLELIRAIPS